MKSKICKLFLIAVFSLITVLASSCAGLGDTLDSILKPRPKNVYTAGYSVQGRRINYSVHGSGKDTIFILGAIHGDEPASAILAEQFEDYLNKNQSILRNRKVIILAVANPDGLAAGTRHNSNGIDLNRNFPTENRIDNAVFGFSAMSEPESVIIQSLISRYEPDRIISIHQPYDCIDYDGPAEHLAKVMAAECPLPVRKLGAAPGSLGSYAGLELAIAIITMELPDSDMLCCGKIWNDYSPALIAAVKYSPK